MESLTEAGDPIRGAAVLEKGYIDIELNICSAEQVGKKDIPPKSENERLKKQLAKK